jgi:ferredoxin
LKRPVVDQEVCDGYRVCIGIAPEVFEINENGKSYVKNPKGADEATIEEAIKGCPAQAISWKEE